MLAWTPQNNSSLLRRALFVSFPVCDDPQRAIFQGRGISHNAEHKKQLENETSTGPNHIQYVIIVKHTKERGLRPTGGDTGAQPSEHHENMNETVSLVQSVGDGGHMAKWGGASDCICRVLFFKRI